MFEILEPREIFPAVQIPKPKHKEREAFMENHGVIIRHLRNLAGFDVRAAAIETEKNTHWFSKVENARGKSGRAFIRANAEKIESWTSAIPGSQELFALT